MRQLAELLWSRVAGTAESTARGGPLEPATDFQPPKPEVAVLTPGSAHLEALAEFAAGAGHEINNPLATIIGRAQLLLRQATDHDERRALQAIVGQAYRVRDMIGDVMTFARPPSPARQRLTFADLINHCRSAVRRAAEHGERSRVSLDFVEPPTSPPGASACVELDPVQLEVVLGELLRNAIEATALAIGQSCSGNVTLAVKLSADEATQAIEIVVTDHGRGWTLNEQQHAFNPFFSGRAAGRGLGFGLCKAWQIARMHGSSLRIESVSSSDQPTTCDPGPLPTVGPTTTRAIWTVPIIA